MIAILALAVISARPLPPEREVYREAAKLYDSGDWPAAEPLLRNALAKFGTKDSDDVWEMRLLLADTLVARTNYPAAADLLAQEAPPRLRHSVIAVRWLLVRSYLAYRMKNVPEASRLLSRAEALTRTYQPSQLADVYGRRAVLEIAKQKFVAAERDAKRSIQLARRQHDRKLELNALGTLAVLRTFQGKYDEAVEYYRRELALASAAGARSKMEKLSGNLGWALILLGDFEAASDYLTNALAIAESIGAEYDLVPLLHNLGTIALHNRDYTRALSYYERGVAVARRIGHRDLGEFLANIAMARLELGDTAGAREANNEASLLSRTAPAEQQLRSVLIDARIDAKSGDVDSAIRKSTRVLASAKTSSMLWEAEARLAQFDVAAKRPEEAEEHFRGAIETAAKTRADVKDEELRLAFGALVREVNEEYVEFLLANGRVNEALEAADRSRAQTLDEVLDAGTAMHHFDPKRLARERNAVIVSYWLAPRRSFVWTITESSIEFQELPPAKTIEQQTEQYSAEIQSLIAARAHGAGLFATLVPRALKTRLPGWRLIVIPDGRLHAFNFETLVEPSSGRFWIEDVTVETASSIELLDRPRKRAVAGSMLLVGDTPSPDRQFPPLTNAADEIERVKRHFPGCHILQGAAATPRAYENADAGRFGYIHFVAHGFATRQWPLDSAVVLAREGDSYKLYARDIIKHPLHAAVVTISSCHGAGTRAYQGEGLVGLAWAFLRAGAHQVIAALWDVSDSATPKMMDDLYAGIRAGRDPATALRDAKLKLIHGGTVYRQPKYWAPFVIYSGS